MSMKNKILKVKKHSLRCGKKGLYIKCTSRYCTYLIFFLNYVIMHIHLVLTCSLIIIFFLLNTSQCISQNSCIYTMDLVTILSMKMYKEEVQNIYLKNNFKIGTLKIKFHIYKFV